MLHLVMPRGVLLVIIGVPDERQPLVAATPAGVEKLIGLGYQVRVQRGAGRFASFPDELYEQAGAQLATEEEVWASDLVIAAYRPTRANLEMMRPGATLLSRLSPDDDYAAELASLGITGLSLDAIPRISRAQSMDVRSSLANVAGYRAVIEAANAAGRLFTGQVTAAGKVPPAQVYVIGAGVAGLAAVGTASSMGANVSATDVRAEVSEQIESMGGHFVAIPVAQESSDGYAKEMSADQASLAQEVYAREAAKSDIVITTALIPGRPAPLLLTREAVEAMKPGSVIVDMAAANGGNCELTVPGEAITTPGGVRIIGYTDLPERLAQQSSTLYGQNIVNFLKLATPEKDGVLHLDLDDPVIRGVCVTIGENIYWPPPPVKVSAAPAPAKVEAPAPDNALAPKPSWAKYLWAGIAAVLLAALILVAPPGMSSHFMIFTLAVVVGFYVITNVTHSLHTPLMSVTNAISGIIVVGAITQINSDRPAVWILAFIALTVASINIFGGFLVTARMLSMFKRS